MTRAATRSPRTWGAWVGFESCPGLLDRLVDGFAGPWTALEAVALPGDEETGRTRTGCTIDPAGAGPARSGSAESGSGTVDVGTPGGTPFRCVVLAARTPADLRRAVALRDLLPWAARVRIAIAEAPPWAAPPLPAPGHETTWSHLADLRVTRAGPGWLLDAVFAEPVPGGDVVAQVALGLFGARRHMTQPVAGLTEAGAARWRPGDPNTTLVPPGGLVPERRDAPGCDLLLQPADLSGDRPADLSRDRAGNPAVDHAARGPRAVPPPRPRPGTAVRPGPAVRGLTANLLPPIDEAVVNPIGFRPHASPQVATLTIDGGGFVVGSDSTGALVRLPSTGDVSDVDVARLRDVWQVMVPALPGRAVAAARIVAALAAAGVPVLAEPDPARDAALGPGLAAAVSVAAWTSGPRTSGPGTSGPGTARALAVPPPVTWGVPGVPFPGPDRPRDAAIPPLPSDAVLRREEQSIRLRRRAMYDHGAVARWRGVARAAGLPVPPDPPVSILLCTRRPEMIPFAIEQMERQRGVDAELVIGLHGVTARETVVGGTVLPVTVVEAPAAMPFGAVLNRMAAVASGSFLAKVDDDDWYGPDHLADLLLAQLYSGAELVGSAAEFVYLEPLDVTIRRRIGTERFAPLVAGGTMLVSRSMFETVGGFRPLARTVDGQLLEAVRAAGGRVYRTHGFNYVLRRRSAHGHTWRQPVESFLASYQEQWRGLVFNELMETTVSHGRRG